MGLECVWRHARKTWSWEFEDFEKEAVESWDLAMESESWFSVIEAELNFDRWKM